MIALVLKATVVLAAAFLAAELLRARSAALRHTVWTAALVAILLLPAGLFAPAWTASVAALPDFAPATLVTATSAAPAAPAPASPEIPWLAILYAAGALAAAATFLSGAVRVSRMARRGVPLPISADYGVRVVAAPDVPVPLAWGIFRPLILLPADAAQWPAARLRAVLLHESMHHRRRDLLTQAAAQLACCAWWFHPLAWLALARQRRERELACDDAVLAHGIAPHDYAASLLEVVRAIAASRRRAHAPAMADAAGLESRVRAVLDRNLDRRPLTRRSAFAVAVAAAALLVPLAAVTLRAQAGGASISGVVRDPSGAVIPGCEVTLRNLDGPNQEVAKADVVGEYRFPAIPAGRYSLDFASRGFARRKLDTTLVSGAAVRLDATLELGQVSESVKVVAPRVTAPPPAQPRIAQRIRVGGNVQPTRIVRQPRPVYPPELQQAGIEATVLIRAVISKEGAVLAPQVVNNVDPRFAKAALEAVSQWRYEPSLLNGEPVETATTISVAFELGQ